MTCIAETAIAKVARSSARDSGRRDAFWPPSRTGNTKLIYSRTVHLVRFDRKGQQHKSGQCISPARQSALSPLLSIAERPIREGIEIRDVTKSELQRLLRDVIGAGMSTNSGIYAGIDPALTMKLNARGEYEYIGLDETYAGSAAALLAVSAFGGVGPDEEDIARELYSSQEDAEFDVIAGHYVGAFAGWDADERGRADGSSGGLATWVLSALLEQGEIDGVVHLKPGGPDGQLFSYQISRSVAEVRNGAKTRYYPGELSSVLREIREVPGRYAIVGIPSFIYEVRLLQRADPLFRERILYTVGLICGHQKTANYASYLAWRGGVEPGTLRSIDFRKKVIGEPANRYSTELIGTFDGVEKTKVVPQTELFGTDWGLGFFKSNFSDLTQDALNETADIVLGDAWLPRYEMDGRGTNVVLVRNSRLKSLILDGARAGQLHLEDIPIDDVIDSQKSLVRQSILEVPYRFRYLARRSERLPAVRRKGLTTDLSYVRRMTQRARVAASRGSHGAYAEAANGGELSVFDKRMSALIRQYKFAQRLARVQRLLSKGPNGILRAVLKRLGA